MAHGLLYGASFTNEVLSFTDKQGRTICSAYLRDYLTLTATGDFYCDPNATIFPTDSVSGIPSGWTRHALADYPQT